MDQEIRDHVPYDIGIEQALLGSILVDNRALERVSDILKPEHLYDPMHRRLFEAAICIRASGMIVTPLTLHAAMNNDAGLMEVGGQAYLDGLGKAAPALPNVRDFARILHDLFVRRALIGIGEDIVNTAYEAPHERSSASQLEAGENALRNLWESEAQYLGAQPRPALAAADWLDRDIPPPDYLLGEILSTTSRLMLVAPTGLGKTNFALQIAASISDGSDFLHWRCPRPAQAIPAGRKSASRDR